VWLPFDRYDAVTYLKYLDTLRVSESFRSVWLFAGASYQIFDYAKKRVFHLVKADGVKFNESSKSVKNKKRKTTGDDKDIEEGDRFFFLLSKKVTDYYYALYCVLYSGIDLDLLC